MLSPAGRLGDTEKLVSVEYVAKRTGAFLTATPFTHTMRCFS